MFSAKSSSLPSFKNFKNLNTLIITPPKINLKNNKMILMMNSIKMQKDLY